MAGWIKLHRSILEKGWIKKPEYVQLWVVLLLLASHDDREYFWNGKTIILKSGQLITGRKSLSQKTGIDENKIERILKCFKSEQQIEQQTTSTSRLISILNWKKFQQFEQPFEQRVNNERTTSEQRVNTNKELKKGNNEKNEKELLFNLFWDLYQHKEDKKKALQLWGKLTIEEMNKIIEVVPKYVLSTPDKQFRKHPKTYLYNRSWENEIIDKSKTNGSTPQPLTRKLKQFDPNAD